MAMTDDEWLLKRIESAQTNERLSFLGWVLRTDSEDGQEYTTDKELMDRYRAAWSKRWHELRQED